MASAAGVWRSVDGGLSWTGLNDFLPNLPSGHFLGLPSGTRGVRLSVANGAGEIEWAPGEKTAWKPVDATGILQRDTREHEERAVPGIETYGNRDCDRRKITSTPATRRAGCGCRRMRA